MKRNRVKKRRTVTKYHDETICAIATPPGTGAIAIVRLSGKRAFKTAKEIFQKKTKRITSNTIYHGYIFDGENFIDEVLISFFRSPNSYTGEDVVEFSCHGSPFIQQQIINLLIKTGVRLAKPGEFTLRAFLNGKLDLSQAEAVADLISSSSDATHKVAIHQIRGGFSKEIKALRSDLIHFASLIELELDFSEEDVEFVSREKLKEIIHHIQKIITGLVDSFEKGNVIKNGIPVVIAGKPNVGKSTLLNVLLNEEKAIVSEIAGTTRDAIEDEINLGGLTFRFIDTAGIRETSDAVEVIGVRKTLEKIKSSAMIIYMFDVHEMTKRELQDSLISLKKEVKDSGAKILPVGNKIDKEDINYIKKEFEECGDIIYISAREKTNISHLTDELLRMVNIGEIRQNETIITNSRHYEALYRTRDALQRAEEGLDEGRSGDLLTADIKTALHHLGEITGEITTDDLLANIFSKFCIGK